MIYVLKYCKLMHIIFCVLGFTVTDKACCETKPNGFCFPESTPCANRNEYVWFDAIHPTEAVNNFVALAAYNSADYPGVTYPLDISQLAQYVTGKGT